MPFEFDDTTKKNYKRAEKFYQTPGTHAVRILDTVAKRINVHTVKMNGKYYTVRCLGDDCPICNNNKTIFVEHPSDYRDVPGYIARSKRYFFNVLDRTQVKVCPNTECQAENKAEDGKNFSPTCFACNTLLVSITPLPSNKVKIFEVSDEVAHNISLLENDEKDEADNVIGWTNYDFVVLKQKGKSPVFKIGKNRDAVEIPEEMKFDLETAVITLTASEIVELLKGTALKDLFAVRRAGVGAGTKTETSTPELEVKEVSDEIKNRIAELYAE